MVGLPTETDDDIKGIASLAQRAYDRAKAAVPPEQRGSVRMSVSCAVFVPKAQTPFQWDGQISPEETLRRVGLLKRSVKYKAVDVHYHDPATSFVEAVMSRGGREVADWVEAAWRRGARFDAWTELFNEEAWTGAAEELGLDPAAIAQVEFPTDYVLPWAHITAAVSPKFLARERERAAAGHHDAGLHLRELLRLRRLPHARRRHRAAAGARRQGSGPGGQSVPQGRASQRGRAPMPSRSSAAS